MAGELCVARTGLPAVEASMSKILLIAIAFAAAYWLLRNHRQRADRHLDRDMQRPADPQTEDMVDCAHCGVHLPRGEGIVSGSRYFCSVEHERQFRPEH